MTWRDRFGLERDIFTDIKWIGGSTVVGAVVYGLSAVAWVRNGATETLQFFDGHPIAAATLWLVSTALLQWIFARARHRQAEAERRLRAEYKSAMDGLHAQVTAKVDALVETIQARQALEILVRTVGHLWNDLARDARHCLTSTEVGQLHRWRSDLSSSVETLAVVARFAGHSELADRITGEPAAGDLQPGAGEDQFVNATAELIAAYRTLHYRLRLARQLYEAARPVLVSRYNALFREAHPMLAHQSLPEVDFPHPPRRDGRPRGPEAP